jgi:hypothetical protein
MLPEQTVRSPYCATRKRDPRRAARNGRRSPVATALFQLLGAIVSEVSAAAAMWMLHHHGGGAIAT